MVARIVLGVALLVLVPAARAEVVVELVPDRPGPYTGGEFLTVDVWLHSEVSSDNALVFIRLDFSETHPALSLEPAFTFDYSSLSPEPVVYDTRFSALPLPWTANHVTCVCPELFLRLPGEGSLHIGSISVTLPTGPGDYRLDALNAGTTDTTHGAAIDVGARWQASDGAVTGGAYTFRVGPPAIPTVSGLGLVVMMLILLAGIASKFRQRRRQTA